MVAGAAGGPAVSAQAGPDRELLARIRLGELVVAAQQDADEGEEREEADDGRDDHPRTSAVIPIPPLFCPSAHERVKKLEARGILRGFMAQVDPASVGLGVLAFMWVTQAPGSIADDITDAFAEIPEVEACHRIAGEGDYLLKIRASDTADLERIVRRVQTTRHVFRTETDVVFSTPFERRPLPILRDGGEGGKTAGGPGS
jgi:Lrp/AsnC family leucine-responsive transcriptional regulator